MELWVNDYVRIPFKEHGRLRSGADCWGLFHIVFDERYGITLEDHGNEYPHTNDKDALSKTICNEYEESWVPVEPGKEKEGDAIIFNMRGVPMHVGIVVGKGFMLHCEKLSGTVYESYKSRKWEHRILGFCRHVGMLEYHS